MPIDYGSGAEKPPVLCLMTWWKKYNNHSLTLWGPVKLQCVVEDLMNLLKTIICDITIKHISYNSKAKASEWIQNTYWMFYMSGISWCVLKNNCVDIMITITLFKRYARHQYSLSCKTLQSIDTHFNFKLYTNWISALLRDHVWIFSSAIGICLLITTSTQETFWNNVCLVFQIFKYIELPQKKS